MKLFAYLIYNLTLLAGAAYLITQHAWSPWWMAGAMVWMNALLMSIGTCAGTGCLMK